MLWVEYPLMVSSLFCATCNFYSKLEFDNRGLIVPYLYNSFQSSPEVKFVANVKNNVEDHVDHHDGQNIS